MFHIISCILGCILMLSDNVSAQYPDYYKSYKFMNESRNEVLNNVLYSYNEHGFEDLIRWAMEQPVKKYLHDIENDNFHNVTGIFDKLRTEYVSLYYLVIYNATSDDLLEMEHTLTKLIDEEHNITVHDYHK